MPVPEDALGPDSAAGAGTSEVVGSGRSARDDMVSAILATVLSSCDVAVSCFSSTIAVLQMCGTVDSFGWCCRVGKIFAHEYHSVVSCVFPLNNTFTYAPYS